MRQEQNLLFLKRAQDEINREKEYKQHFIKYNEIQMRRNEALVKALDKGDTPVYGEEGDIKLINIPRYSRSKNTSKLNTKPMSPNLNRTADEIRDDKEYETNSLENVKRNQYRRVLETQIRERQLSGERFDKIGQSKKISDDVVKSTNYGIAMIPGINSTSPFVQKPLRSGSEQTLDEHRRKMKKFIASGYGGFTSSNSPYASKNYINQKRLMNNHSVGSLKEDDKKINRSKRSLSHSFSDT